MSREDIQKSPWANWNRFNQGLSNPDLKVEEARRNMFIAGQQPTGKGAASLPPEPISGETFSGKLVYHSAKNIWIAEIRFNEDGRTETFESTSRQSLLSTLADVDEEEESKLNAQKKQRQRLDEFHAGIKSDAKVPEGFPTGANPFDPNDPRVPKGAREAYFGNQAFAVGQQFLREFPEFYDSERNINGILGWLHARKLPITLENYRAAFNDLYDRHQLEEWPAPQPVVAEPEPEPVLESLEERKERQVLIRRVLSLKTLPSQDANGTPLTRGFLESLALPVLRDIVAACEEELHRLQSTPIQQLKTQVHTTYRRQ